jgi:hypothetical protein
VIGHRRLALLVALLAAAFPPALRAQENDDVSDQTVARVAFLQGTATYNRGDDPDDWQPAEPNFPLTTGDRFWTSRDSRVELQADPGSVFLAPETDFSILSLTDDVSRFSMGEGTASFRIRHQTGAETLEVAAPNAAVTLLSAGYYRVDVDASGDTRVSVFRGAASVAAGGGEVRLKAGDAIHVEGIDAPRYEVVDVPARDAWDQWVESRARRYRDAATRYTSAAQVGYYDLDQYGHWQEIPSYGRVWTPSAVAAGWVPYRDGSWVWRDPWGWTWVSSEPWGWAPYHYGRWVLWSSRWYWVPDPPSVHVRWAPAYVAFVGAGPGWSISIGAGGGYVGWFPLAPREPFQPWWGRPHSGPTVVARNVTYVNRNYVTVVGHDKFISGAPVARNIVRERDVVRRIESAPIAHGSIPVTPSHASLHVAAGPASERPRPPAPVLSRSVVSRMPPPPTPRPFAKRHEAAPSPSVEVSPGRPPAEVSRTSRPAPPPEPKPARVSPTTPHEQAHPEARPVQAAPRSHEQVRPEARPVQAAPSRHEQERPPAPATQVRPAQAERVRLEPKGQEAPRRKVEPLKAKETPKKKEAEKPAPKKQERKENQ